MKGCLPERYKEAIHAPKEGEIKAGRTATRAPA